MNEKQYYSLKGYVSSSSLKYLEEDPTKFKQFIEGELEQEETSYLSFGRLVHLYLLERQAFLDQVRVLDYTTPKSPQQKQFFEDLKLMCSWKKSTLDTCLIEAYRNNYATKEKDDTVLSKAQNLADTFTAYDKYLTLSETKHVITPKILDKLEAIQEGVRAHKKANELLISKPNVMDDIVHLAETPIIWDFGKTKCKSLLDKVIVDRDNKTITIVDLKTTSNLNAFKDSFNKYRYDRQLAFYRTAILHGHDRRFIEDRDDINDYTIVCKIVAVDTINHRVKVFNVSEETLLTATDEIKDLLERADWHIKENKWDYTKEYYEGDGTEEL